MGVAPVIDSEHIPFRELRVAKTVLDVLHASYPVRDFSKSLIFRPTPSPYSSSYFRFDEPDVLYLFTHIVFDILFFLQGMPLASGMNNPDQTGIIM